jgi:UDP-glucose 4-epimerase
MRVLVTGGAGFIGSCLAARLIQEGHEVDVLDNLSTGLEENIPPKASFLHIDLSDPNFIKKLPRKDYQAVCHLAAQSSGAISNERPLYDVQTNALSTLLLSRWCVENQIPRFLFASSMLAYGHVPAEKSPVSEDWPCAPLSYYGIGKVASESYLRILNRSGLSSTSFRMFNVYGPGQNMSNLKQGMVSIYLAYLLKGEKLTLTGSLDRFRDLVYIDDVIDVWTAALSRSSTPSLVYNVGFGTPTTVHELLNLMLKTCGLPKDYPIQEGPNSPMEQFGLFADIGRAKKDFVWQPKVNLEEGLRRMVEWARPQRVNV